MIRDFARHIVEISAWAGKKQLSLTKEDKHTWMVEPFKGAIQVRYQVYAWDLSVRAAHVDQTHAFFNGSSVFLSVEGQENQAHVLDVVKPTGALYKKWRVATSLLELTATRYDFGRYIAKNYDDLIDHPIEMGEFKKLSFKAHGIKHDIIITGKVINLDEARLCSDLKKICETQIEFFDPIQKKAPMDRYVFLMMVVGEGYGGLEHRSSTALLCSRTDFPVLGSDKMSDAYCTLLGLCSHEYFHAWNVKRIKPAVFAPYQLFSETYTSLLWLFEGGTSYYDDLMLLRSGVIDEARYFSLLAKTINSVLSTPGRFKQSVGQASFDAWNKYYKQDENSPNVTISYYTKGALVNLALDLTIRIQTNGKKSLDDVMRALWEKYGKNFYIQSHRKQGQGVTEEMVRTLFDKVTGLSLSLFFKQYVDDVVELPLCDLLNQAGFKLKQEELD
jgi:predicted metalloprotease with PDZ domain